MDAELILGCAVAIVGTMLGTLTGIYFIIGKLESKVDMQTGMIRDIKTDIGRLYGTSGKLDRRVTRNEDAIDHIRGNPVRRNGGL